MTGYEHPTRTGIVSAKVTQPPRRVNLKYWKSSLLSARWRGPRETVTHRATAGGAPPAQRSLREALTVLKKSNTRPVAP